MTSDEERYPDIEIYLHETSAQEILEWLKQRFSSVQPDTLPDGGGTVNRLELEGDQGTIPVTIVPRITGRFTGIAFDSGMTPWASDRECALEAFAHFGVEVRCCAGSWQADQDPDEWLRIDEHGEELITWRT